MCVRETVSREQASLNDKHVTSLGFTALNGEPVRCLVIVTGIQQKYQVETGIDVDVVPIGLPSDAEYVIMKRGKGKLYPMGSICQFNGKTIPCLVQWSPFGSITSEILRDAPSTIDHHEVFDQSTGRKPFLLLDGQHSHFKLPFLEYVTNVNHKWMV